MKDLTKDKKPYEEPQVTVVTFKTERGYAESGVGAGRNGYQGGYDSDNDSYGNNQLWD